MLENMLVIAAHVQCVAKFWVYLNSRNRGGIGANIVMSEKGCNIYGQRSNSCREFNCLYILDLDFPESWKPNKSKMVVVREDGAITIHVDPNMPSIWRDAPYYVSFKKWATELENEKVQFLFILEHASS